MQYSATCRRRSLLLDFSVSSDMQSSPSAGFDVSSSLHPALREPVSFASRAQLASLPSASLNPHLSRRFRSSAFCLLSRTDSWRLFTVYEAPTNARGVAITANCSRSVKERSTARKFRAADMGGPRDRIFICDKRDTGGKGVTIGTLSEGTNRARPARA